MSAPSIRRRWLRISLYAAAGFLLGIAAVAAFLVIRFQPVARQYFIATLQNRYQCDVELGTLQISFFPVVQATGDNLVLWFHGRRDGPPMIRMRRFILDADFIGFFHNPKQIAHLRLEGLRIHPPPRAGTASSTTNSSAPGSSPPAATFVLDEVIADGATLETTPKDPAKLPLIFEIRQLALHTVGPGRPMTFHAELTNPKPPGLIHADGKFGPWNSARPIDTPLSGKYTFRDADLSVFRGIAGKLSSDGQFTGLLDRLEVEGTTDTPDFALKIGGHPMPLHTDFQATVDGANGNTVLHPVHARLGQSEFDVEGAIDRGALGALETRKTILLEARTSANHRTPRLEDFLRLPLKGPRS